MKQPDQILFIENDEVGLFLAESVFTAIELPSAVHYKKDPKKALNFIKKLKPSPETRITVFASATIFHGEDDFVREFREALAPLSSRFCLLSSMPHMEKKEKSWLEEMSISSFIEKPLTEDKFTQALRVPFNTVLV